MSTLIIGVGNPHRGDDAAGLITAQRLRAQSPYHLQIIEQTGEAAALIESWKDANPVIMIDAVHSGSRPGTIHRFEANEHPISTSSPRSSSHTLGVAEAIEMARALHRLPSRLIVYGIEGKNWGVGDALSPQVEEAIAEVMQHVLQDIHSESFVMKRGKE
jgi:hydrogenase maturation protease